MIQVKDGKIISTNLPKNSFLSNGRAVSNYNRLPKAILEVEGWVEEIEVKPTVTKEQMLGAVKYEIVDGKVIKTYEVLEKPKIAEPEPDPIDDIKKRLEAIEGKVLMEVKG